MRGGEKRQHHHHHRLPGFLLGHGHEKKEAAGMPPKGCMAIRVGLEGAEEPLRFVVPVAYLNHPLFLRLLKEAEEEYGFAREGAITLPCRVDDFLLVQEAIDRETAEAHHHHSHHHHHHHHHVLHLAGCFRA